MPQNNTMSLWLTRILDFISPRLCVVCGCRLTPTERSLCSLCVLHLPRTYWQQQPQGNPMAQLFWHLTPVERAVAMVYFQPHSETADVIYQLKYGDRPDIGEDLGRLMATELLASQLFSDVDVLLPVPIAPRRRRQRGYNQSDQLARGIAAVTGLPVESGLLTRHHFEKSQTALTHRERQANVDGQFAVRRDEPLRHRHVLLIDDVCTTGATLRACADALKGIEGIRISVLTWGFSKS